MVKLSSLMPAIRTLATSLARYKRVAPANSSQLEAVEQARREWHSATDYYHQITDPEQVEYAAFELKARERRYVYLLQRARQCKLVVDDRTFGAWLGER